MGEFEAHLLACPLVVTGEVAALGPPAFGVGVEGESGVRLGGDGEDFIGPLGGPAADVGAGLPAGRRAGDEVWKPRRVSGGAAVTRRHRARASRIAAVPGRAFARARPRRLFQSRSMEVAVAGRAI